MSSPDRREYARRWERDFREALSPRFMPEGWGIVSVTNLDAIKG